MDMTKMMIDAYMKPLYDMNPSGQLLADIQLFEKELYAFAADNPGAVDIVGDILHEDDIETWSRLFNAYVSSIISEYMLDGEEMDKLIALLDKTEQKEFKKLFTTLQRAEEQEKVIRDFITPHFDAVISEREKFMLPSGEEIMDAITET